MEYLGQCPKCKRHTIVTTIKKIRHSSTERLPQRNVKCLRCGSTERITIIGERIERTVQPETIDPEIASEIQPNNHLMFKLWVQPTVIL